MALNINPNQKKLIKKTVAMLLILVFAAVVIRVLDIDILPEFEEIGGINSDITLDSSPENESSNVNKEDPTNTTPVPEGVLQVAMIECGQADSFLFVQNDVVALVDCGTRSTGTDVVNYLKSVGIETIDFLVGTHPHEDHMGGMYDVITNFNIGTIITPEVETGEVTSLWYLKLMVEINEKNHNVIHPKVNDVFNIGDATMTIIGPPDDFDPNGNINNYSIVSKISYGDIDIIMTGDTETEVEELLIKSGIDLNAEILKVGHHGSSTSSSDEFLDSVNPTYALISCKLGNKFDHPTKQTMDKLNERNIDVYRTDESGTVIITITANDITFNTNPDDYKSGPELAGGN